MKRLLHLSLEGNRIERLEDETFQNIHRLQTLNLAYNRISSVNFAAFDSIGTLSHLTIDLSHNNLQVKRKIHSSILSHISIYPKQALRVNRSNSYPIHSNIMHMDLSHNNISMIEVTFFEPVESDLKVLNLSSNIVEEISPDDVGQLRRLRCIDVSRNRLRLIEPTTFMAARRLQSVYLHDNRLEEVPQTLFSSQNYLQFVDFSRYDFKVKF